MGYVVKATRPDGTANWLSDSEKNETRRLVDRESAAVFASRFDAHKAIAGTPSEFDRQGMLITRPLPAFHLGHLTPIAGNDRDPGTDRRAITHRANRADVQPVVRVTVVAK